jgi:UDP-N-acetylmuramate--alanine ligase
VGIGGIGISAIARVLLEQGYRVSGSDLCPSAVFRALADLGAVVHLGHDAAHLGEADTVLISSAIPASNPEVRAARARGLPVLKRAEFLGRLMDGQRGGTQIGIAVAGTHGKTSTTGMVVTILDHAQLDPTFIVGGVIPSLNTNARAGRGPHFVIEADEYDHMFLGLRPTVAAITHLEHDHPDCFPSMADMEAAFDRFLDLVPAEGLIVGCADPPAVAALLGRARGRSSATIVTCGLQAGRDWRAVGLEVNARGGYSAAVFKYGAFWGSLELQAPGVHNLQNALLALAVADHVGVDRAQINEALSGFGGVRRRFEVVGRAGGVTVIDDYGHHPTEIRATLQAARARYGERPVWAVFQPHTYTRLAALWDAFCACFDDADHVIVLDIYAAREKDTLGLSAATLAEQIRHPDVRHVSGLERAAPAIVDRIEPDAVVITLSAGDGNLVGTRVLEQIEERAKRSGELRASSQPGI